MFNIMNIKHTDNDSLKVIKREERSKESPKKKFTLSEYKKMLVNQRAKRLIYR